MPVLVRGWAINSEQWLARTVSLAATPGSKLLRPPLKPAKKCGSIKPSATSKSASNAILFINNVCKNREIIVDASVYGMGRGAGNLCDELIINYLNEKFNKKYKLFPILEIVDNILSDIKKQNYWGYSLEYYLSAVNHCHPNYCIYFSDMKTLTTYDLAKIVGLISEDKKMDFDKEYALGIYQSYNNKKYVDNEDYNCLRDKIKNKKIILIGPGKSLVENKSKIRQYVNSKEKYYSISVNVDTLFNTDAIFISNRKRCEEFNNFKDRDYLLTSNIDMKIKGAMIFDYYDNLAKSVSELEKEDEYININNSNIYKDILDKF